MKSVVTSTVFVFLQIFVFSISSSKIQKGEQHNGVPSVQKLQHPHDNIHNSTNCGGTLTEASGQISYKVYEPVLPNERCVWIIRSNKTTDYAIAVFYLGFGFPSPNADQQVIISGLAHGRNITHVIPSDDGLITMSNCTVLIVTFHSGPTNFYNYTGFSLQFSSFHNGGVVSPSLTSKDIVVDSDLGYLKYPSVGSSYTHLELTSFLFLRNQNLHGANQEVSIVYMRDSLGLATGCADSLKIYLFNTDIPTKWDYAYQLCSSNETAIITNNEMILIIFESDSSTAGTGFHFTYSRCIKEEAVVHEKH